MKTILHNKNIFLIIAITTITYMTMLFNHEVWDDGFFIDYKGFEFSTTNIEHLLLGALPMAEGKLYRPVRSLLYVISLAITHKSVLALHIQGLLIHLVITYGVYQFCKQTTKNERISVFSSILFGVHPMHIEAVSFITATFDTIGLGFGLYGLIAHIKYRFTNNKKYLSIALILLTLGYFTYELSYAYIFILILTDIFFTKTITWKKSTITTYCTSIKWYLMTFCATVLIRALAVSGNTNKLPHLFNSLYASIAFVPVIVSHYLNLLFLPFSQSANHTIYPNLSNFSAVDPGMTSRHAVFSLFSVSYILPLFSFLIISFVMYETGKQNRRIWYFYLFTLAALIPVLQIIPLYSIFAERYIYLASIGTSVLIAYAIDAIPNHKIKYAVFACTTILFCIITINRNKVWNNTVTFWQDVVDHTLPSAYAYRNLAGSYYIYQDYQKAADLLTFAATLQPRNLDTYKKLFYIYKFEFKDDIRAAEVLNQAAHDFPEKADVIKNQLYLK